MPYKVIQWGTGFTGKMVARELLEHPEFELVAVIVSDPDKDGKDIGTLSRLSTGQGKMFSRKRSGNCARHQRQFKAAIKYARFMALMPYVAR